MVQQQRQFASIADVEVALGATLPAATATHVAYLLESTSTAVTLYLGYNYGLDLEDRVEERTVDSGAVQVRCPINESTTPVAVTKDDVPLTVGTDFSVDLATGVLSFPTVVGAVTVTYRSGYNFELPPIDVLSSVLRDVTVAAASRKYLAAASVHMDTLGIKSVSIAGSDSITFTDSSATSAAQAAALTSDDEAQLAAATGRATRGFALYV